jgi:NAD(P)-dependent dehydrogenase (short-subunit alcohol dehydrogenase family)
MAIVLITGTSTGIGLATAVACARGGHEVYATMRDPARAPQLQTLARQEGLPVSVLPLDVDNDASVRGAVEQLLAARGRLDVLVNNAGIAPMGTDSTEAAIPPHILYLLVRKGITPALSGVPDGRNHEGNTSITARIDLFWQFKGTMTSYRSFRAAGPSWSHRSAP